MFTHKYSLTFYIIFITKSQKIFTPENAQDATLIMHYLKNFQNKHFQQLNGYLLLILKWNKSMFADTCIITYKGNIHIFTKKKAKCLTLQSQGQVTQCTHGGSCKSKVLKEIPCSQSKV